MDILHGDCREVMRGMADDSVDAIVTDPPYGLNKEPDIAEVLRHWLAGDDYTATGGGFMGKTWDSFVPGPSIWREAFRVLKPGGHLVAFFGSRTYDIGAIAIRLAGFEIRDQGAWLYGSGFPKSLDVSKAIDKAAGAEREVVGRETRYNEPSGIVSAGRDERKLVDRAITAPATPAAQQWSGWGTALKPSQEPLCFARKPYTCEQEWVTIRFLVERLWSAIWLTLPVNTAEQFSALNPRASNVETSAFAQWSAGQRSSILDALSGLTDTSQSVSAMISSLNTVSSWNDILAESCRAGNMSTTKTGLSATTELRTLRLCLSQIMPANIIAAHKSGRWSNADACNAVRTFNAIVAALNATQEHFAVENATGLEARSSPGAGGSYLNHEPICFARKPLVGTVAENVLRYGTGALNVDGCRVGTESTSRTNRAEMGYHGGNLAAEYVTGSTAGRWPANVMHDGSPEVLAVLGDAARFFYSPKASKRDRDEGLEAFEAKSAAEVTGRLPGSAGLVMDGGKANPFAGPSGEVRRNVHPTVKPTDLMRWLCRLVTPPGGVVLDPFTGSGSTGKAAVLEGFRFIGIEREAEYIEIARARIAAAQASAPLLTAAE